MQVDSHIVLILVLNISFILAFSWLGIRIVNNNCPQYRFNNDQNVSRVSKIVKESSIIIPRIRVIWKIRRMVKSNAEKDETPFSPPQLT